MPKDHLMCLFVFMCHILITMKGFSIEMLFFNLLTVPTQSFTEPIITSKRLTLTLLDLFFHYTFLLIFFLTKPQRDFFVSSHHLSRDVLVVRQLCKALQREVTPSSF